MEDKNVKYIIKESVASATVFYLTNPFFSMFAKRMGATDYELSMINALPSLMAFFVLIPGSILLDNCRDKKMAVVRIVLVQALLLPIIGISPFLGSQGVWIFIIGISLMNGPISVYNIGWQSLFSDIFCGELRIKTYSRRTRMYTLIGMIVTVMAGIIMTNFPNNESQRLLYYQSFYAVAFIFCIYQSLTLSSLSVESKKQIFKRSIIQNIKDIKFICTKKYISFVIIAFFVNGAWYFGHALFFVYHANYLGSNEMWISIMTVGSSIACVVTYKYWSDFMLKYGANKTLVIGAMGLALNPLVVLAENMYIYVFLATLFSFSFPAFQLGLFESVLKAINKEYKTLAIAFYTSIISVGAFFAPILGIWLYSITTIKFAMYTCVALRAISAIFCYYKMRIDD